VSVTLNGRFGNQRVYIHISMHLGRTSPYGIRQVDISGKIKIYGRNMTT